MECGLIESMRAAVDVSPADVPLRLQAACFIIAIGALASISMFRRSTDVAIGISYLGFFLQFVARRPTARARC